MAHFSLGGKPAAAALDDTVGRAVEQQAAAARASGTRGGALLQGVGAAQGPQGGASSQGRGAPAQGPSGGAIAIPAQGSHGGGPSQGGGAPAQGGSRASSSERPSEGPQRRVSSLSEALSPAQGEAAPTAPKGRSAVLAQHSAVFSAISGLGALNMRGRK